MITEHTAIFKLYPNVVTVRDNGKDEYICKDKDGNLVSVDVSAINAEFANLEYKNKRQAEYPSVVDQLDDIYHNGIDAWKATIKTTKDKYPKP